MFSGWFSNRLLVCHLSHGDFLVGFINVWGWFSNVFFGYCNVPGKSGQKLWSKDLGDLVVFCRNARVLLLC